MAVEEEEKKIKEGGGGGGGGGVQFSRLLAVELCTSAVVW